MLNKAEKKSYNPPAVESEEFLYEAALACGKCESLGQPLDLFNCSISGSNS